ncbi:hypothetical protein RF55_25450 [Lasius niger]|uniref:Uncharacterized protein n=1 Tax=Lasius niger TaxID=67767 RepID=A0A0J7JUH4_LASNI|nr:hypothetical protein RF55_25450 [Lasius niger]
MCSPASAASSRGTKRAATDDDDDDDDASTPAHCFLPKRLRRCASRDMALPKLRAAATTVRRTVSRPDSPPARLSKRNPYGAVALSPALLRARDGLRAPRVLRPRVVAGPLSVVPDANRGIPRGPAIPAKFAHGQDAENDGPCRR